MRYRGSFEGWTKPAPPLWRRRNDSFERTAPLTAREQIAWRDACKALLRGVHKRYPIEDEELRRWAGVNGNANTNDR
jgi:hypothetical protein